MKKRLKLTEKNTVGYLAKGRQIHFFDPLGHGSFVTATVVRVNKNSVTAIEYADSGWNNDFTYKVNFENVLAVITDDGNVIAIK